MPSSPSARQSQLRSYESFIAPSPKTHAILKAPLSRLRRRTSELVDQITGATVAEDVVQEEQRLRDEARKWKCRACNVPFAGERELNKVSSHEMGCMSQLFNTTHSDKQRTHSTCTCSPRTSTTWKPRGKAGTVQQWARSLPRKDAPDPARLMASTPAATLDCQRLSLPAGLRRR